MRRQVLSEAVVAEGMSRLQRAQAAAPTWRLSLADEVLIFMSCVLPQLLLL